MLFEDLPDFLDSFENDVIAKYIFVLFRQATSTKLVDVDDYINFLEIEVEKLITLLMDDGEDELEHLNMKIGEGTLLSALTDEFPPYVEYDEANETYHCCYLDEAITTICTKIEQVEKYFSDKREQGYITCILGCKNDRNVLWLKHEGISNFERITSIRRENS